MAPFSIWRGISALLLLVLLPMAWALKFDIHAHMGQADQYARCIRNHASRETLVVVTAIIGGAKNDGQQVSMHVCLVHPTSLSVKALMAVSDQRH